MLYVPDLTRAFWPHLLFLTLVLVCAAADAFEREHAARGPGSTRTLRIVRGLLSLPVIWLALFAALVARVGLRLGHWPYPMERIAAGGSTLPWDQHYPLHPDAMHLHNVALMIGAWVVASLTVIGPALIAVSAKRHRRRWGLAECTFALSMGVYWFLLRVDPGQYVRWLGSD